MATYLLTVHDLISRLAKNDEQFTRSSLHTIREEPSEEDDNESVRSHAGQPLNLAEMEIDFTSFSATRSRSSERPASSSSNHSKSSF